MRGIFVTWRRSGSAEVPEAAGAVEGLDRQHAAAAVAEDEEPPCADAARVGELGPAAAKEGAVAVAPDLDAPQGLALAAERAGDEGLPGADLLGELVGDPLQSGRKRSAISTAAARGAERKRRSLLTRLSQVNGSSTLRCLAAAAWSPDDAIAGGGGQIGI